MNQTIQPIQTWYRITCWCFRIAPFAVILLIIFLVSAQHVLAQAVFDNEKAVKTILSQKQKDWGKEKERWQKVSNELLRPVTPETPSPVARMLKGHACLASDQNNESLCLFLSVSSEDDLNAWSDWMQKFVNAFPDKAIPYYFRGDALARLKHWDQAIDMFNKALDISRTAHPLFLNARGVAYAANGELRYARVDFHDATTQVDFPLADAHANIGALRIQKKAGADKAIMEFNKALEISPDFALALHGRGCVELILSQIEEAEKDFKSAQDKSACAQDLIINNLLNLEAYISGMNRKELLAMLLEGDVSMQLTKAFEAVNMYNHTPTMGNLRDVVKSFDCLGGVEQQRAFDYMVNNLTPVAQTKIFDHTGRGIAQHSPGSPIHDMLHSIPDAFNLSVTVVGTGGGGGVSYAKALENFQNVHQRHGQLYERIQTELYKSLQPTEVSTTGSGVLTTFAGAIWDDEEWPFDAYYGLFYQGKYHEISLE